MEKEKKAVFAQISVFAISCLVLCFSPFCTYDGTKTQKIFAIVISTVFWAGLLIGVVINFVIKSKFSLPSGKSGIIRFFANKYAKIFDILFVIALILSIVVIVTKTELSIGSTAIALCIFSFEMHCVLNGKCFNKLLKGKEEKINGEA